MQSGGPDAPHRPSSRAEKDVPSGGPAAAALPEAAGEAARSGHAVNEDVIDQANRDGGGEWNHEEMGFALWQVFEEVQSVAWRFWIGALEALAVNNVWRMLRKSRPLWVTVRNAVLFNAIWMGFGFFHRAVVSRAIWRLLGDPHGLSVQARITDGVLFLFWNLLLYLLLILLSVSWYQDTAQRGCQLVKRKGKPPSDALDAWRQLLESMGDEVYRLLLVGVFWLCAKAVQWSLTALGSPLLATLGTLLYALGCSWMASFYAFEYVWSMIGWSLDERLRCFERRCAYFAGFGAPLTLATFSLPFFPATAVYASCFPLLILLAAAASPKEHRDAKRLPLFGVPHRAADAVCRNADSLTPLLLVADRLLALLALTRRAPSNTPNAPPSNGSNASNVLQNGSNASDNGSNPGASNSSNAQASNGSNAGALEPLVPPAEPAPLSESQKELIPPPAAGLEGASSELEARLGSEAMEVVEPVVPLEPVTGVPRL